MRVRATPTISREFEPGLGDALRSFAEWLQLEQGLTHREIEAKNGPMTTTTTLRDAAGLAQTLTRSDMVIEVESVELTVQHGETVRRDDMTPPRQVALSQRLTPTCAASAIHTRVQH